MTTSARLSARVGALLCGLLLAPMIPVFAQAQSDSEPTPEQLFREGVEHLENERFETARSLLRRALSLEERASTAFNLASAEHGAGNSEAALVLLDRLGSGDFGPLRENFSEPMATLRTSVEASLGQVNVRLVEPETANLEIDGGAVTELRQGTVVRLLLAAGSRRLESSSQGYQTREDTLIVERGSTQELLLTLEPSGVVLPDPDLIAPPEESEGQSPLPWILAGVGLAAVVATVIVVVLTAGTDAPPMSEFMCDPVLGCIET